MQFTDRFKRRFSLAEQANIGKKNISIFDLRLGAFTVDPGAVSPFNSGGKSPASIGGEFVTNLTQWRETSPH